jgi:hypothetical protein
MPVSLASSASSSTKGSLVALGHYVADGNSAGTTFSNIPQTYQDLMLVLNGGGTRAVANDHLLMAINTDTSSNYSYTYIQADGSAASSVRGTAGAFAVLFNCYSGSLSTVGTYGSGILHILDYTNTNKFKTILGKAGIDLNTSGYLTSTVNLYKANTNSITNLYCITYTNLLPGSTLTLYGVRSVGQ